MSPFHLLIGGAWVPIPGVARNPGKKSDRPSSETISLGGVRRRQRARRAPRTWSLSFLVKSPDVLRWLTVAAQGLGGDVYLLDAAAARINMLDPLDTVGRDLAVSTIEVNGVQLRMFPDQYAFTVKCRAGVTYHFSGVTTRVAGANPGKYKIGAAAQVFMVAPTGTGARPFSTSFTPTVDADVLFTIYYASDTGSSGLRLTEGSIDTLGFLPGQKAVCQVSIDDPDHALDLFVADQLPLTTSTVTILEVGL